MDEQIAYLERKAIEARKTLITVFYRGGGGHFGGSLSPIDVFTALYFHVLNIDPKNPRDPARDRFVLSKGHANVGLVSVLFQAGFISQEVMDTYNDQVDSPVSMHPDMNITPGIEMSTGSLGHGIGVAVGMAIAAKRAQKEHMIFCLIGDGETHEGSVWEAAMAAAHYNLDNLVVITDRNQLSMDGPTEDVLRLEPLQAKWEAFGWATRSIDGHNMKEIISAFDDVPFQKGKPTQIIAKTIKGKGLELAEGRTEWHYGAINHEQWQQAIANLEGKSL